MVGHEDRAALLRNVLALVDADPVDGMREQPGQELDRRLRNQHDDVDEHGHGRQAAQQEDFSRSEQRIAVHRATATANKRPSDEHAAEREEIAGRQDRAAMLGRAAILHVGGQRHVEQAGADAEHHEQHAGGDVAHRVVPAGIDQHAFDGEQQEREEGQPAGTERQDAQLDFAARPQAGQHAAQADADNQRRQQAADTCVWSSKPCCPRTQTGRCSTGPASPTTRRT